MIKFGTKARSLKAAIAVGTLLGGVAMAQPSLSAQSDIDRIHSYAGVWQGSGKLHDAEGNSETIRCRITMTKSSEAKLTLNGNCTGAGMGKQSLTGALAYVIDSNRYESVISAPIRSTVVGRKRGSNVSFHFSQSVDRPDVDKATADFVLQNNAMNFEFKIDFEDGGQLRAAVPLVRR